MSGFSFLIDNCSKSDKSSLDDAEHRTGKSDKVDRDQYYKCVRNKDKLINFQN